MLKIVFLKCFKMTFANNLAILKSVSLTAINVLHLIARKSVQESCILMILVILSAALLNVNEIDKFAFVIQIALQI